MHAIVCDAIAMQKIQITIGCVVDCAMVMFATTNILWLMLYWQAIFCNGVSSNNKSDYCLQYIVSFAFHSIGIRLWYSHAMFCNGIQCHNQNEWCFTSTLRSMHKLMLRNDKSKKLIITQMMPIDSNGKWCRISRLHWLGNGLMARHLFLAIHSTRLKRHFSSAEFNWTNILFSILRSLRTHFNENRFLL